MPSFFLSDSEALTRCRLKLQRSEPTELSVATSVGLTVGGVTTEMTNKVYLKEPERKEKNILFGISHKTIATNP